jgi:hypothetical protein
MSAGRQAFKLTEAARWIKAARLGGAKSVRFIKGDLTVEVPLTFEELGDAAESGRQADE